MIHNNKVSGILRIPIGAKVLDIVMGIGNGGSKMEMRHGGLVRQRVLRLIWQILPMERELERDNVYGVW